MSGLLEVLIPYIGYLALALRVWVGANYMLHGYPKLSGQGRQQAAQWMKSIGLPAGAAYTAAILEFFGGLFLIIGLIVPIVALFFAIEMIATALLKKTKMKATYIKGQNTYELDVTYFLLAMVLIVLGAGAFSIDQLVGL